VDDEIFVLAIAIHDKPVGDEIKESPLPYR
jgi:hypothetical protein